MRARFLPQVARSKGATGAGTHVMTHQEIALDVASVSRLETVHRMAQAERGVHRTARQACEFLGCTQATGNLPCLARTVSVGVHHAVTDCPRGHGRVPSSCR